MNAVFTAIIGIFVGFLINTLWQYHKEKKNRKQKIEQIQEELRSNSHEIHQKKDLIRKIIEHLNSKKILSGDSVEFIKTYYSTYLNEVYPYLSALERNSLHVIYQYFILTDRMMNNFEGDIMKFLASDIIKNKDDVYRIFSGKFSQSLQLLEKTEKLIENHLKGRPIDVFYINKKRKPEKLR